MESVKILGYELSTLVDMMNTTESQKVNKALAYLDGKQEEELVKVLDDGNKGRKNWKSRGFIPRYRNLVKPIVTHSGMLFKNTLPTFGIYDDSTADINDSATSLLFEELSKLEFEDVLSALDEVVRLVKTGILLVQYNVIDNELSHTILHRGNSAVVSDGNGGMVGLIYLTGYNTYRMYTPEFIYDIESDEKREHFTITDTNLNPYECIPAVPFYDTSYPRCGFWNHPGMDLVNVNEQYNIHLTDCEFSLSWAKMPTLYTNCKIDGGQEELEVSKNYGEVLPSLTAVNGGLIGGPGKVIQLDSIGVDSPFVEYKAPVFDIASMDDVQQTWVKNVAYDWSVRMDIGGEGRANSGFQLIVEEIPNMELRQQRQKMFTMGFKKWYKVVSKVLNYVYGSERLPIDSELFVDFNNPKLPVEHKENEEVWTMKIDNGRASRVDYFVQENGMSIEESEAKVEEIDKYNANDDGNGNLPDGIIPLTN